jgi:CbiX
MRVALVDNGSLEAASHLNLRSVARAVSELAAVRVEPVSWRHSGRIPAAELGGVPADTLASWIRDRLAEGERRFLFVPFFISAQGSIGSSLHGEVRELSRRGSGFEFAFTTGFASPSRPAGSVLAEIVASRVTETVGARTLARPAVVVVDHGGPSAASARLRDEVARLAAGLLGATVRAVAPASMESPDGPPFSFNEPLLENLLGSPGFDQGDVVIAPLFLSPGRHAGPGGDLERIAGRAEHARPQLRCRFTGLVGTHPAAAEAIALSLRDFLSEPRFENAPATGATQSTHP